MKFHVNLFYIQYINNSRRRVVRKRVKGRTKYYISVFFTTLFINNTVHCRRRFLFEYIFSRPKRGVFRPFIIYTFIFLRSETAA